MWAQKGADGFRLEFDDVQTENPGRSAKDITGEMSDASLPTGFLKISAVTLNDHADGQAFAVQALVPGRWVQLTSPTGTANQRS